MRIKKMIINMIQEALPCQNYSKCIMNSMEKNNTFKLTAVTAGATLKPGNRKPEIVLLYYLAVY